MVSTKGRRRKRDLGADGPALPDVTNLVVAIEEELVDLNNSARLVKQREKLESLVSLDSLPSFLKLELVFIALDKRQSFIQTAFEDRPDFSIPQDCAAARTPLYEQMAPWIAEQEFDVPISFKDIGSQLMSLIPSVINEDANTAVKKWLEADIVMALSNIPFSPKTYQVIGYYLNSVGDERGVEYQKLAQQYFELYREEVA